MHLTVCVRILVCVRVCILVRVFPCILVCIFVRAAGEVERYFGWREGASPVSICPV